MKLNYTLAPARGRSRSRSGAPSSTLPRRASRWPCCFLHGQLPCVAWAAAQARRARIGYVQTAGGALPGRALATWSRELLERGLLAGHVTAGPAFGGEHEAITSTGALHAGLTELGWDAAIAGPGPGILGSATALGHGGMAALDTAHAALALGCRTIVVPRMSSGDPRARHRGLSHHTRTVLELLLRPVESSRCPAGERWTCPGEHERPRPAAADLEGYRTRGLPARTMGRTLDEDELFFRAALAGGRVARRRKPTRWRSSGSAARRSGAARSRPSASTASATRRRRGGRARVVGHPGAVAIVAHDGEHVYLVQPAARGRRRAAAARAAGRQARRGGGGAARHRQARARRGDRQGRRASGST